MTSQLRHLAVMAGGPATLLLSAPGAAASSRPRAQGPSSPAIIGVQPTSTFICPANPCVALPVTLTRTTSEPVLGYSVTIQLSGNLSKCSITEGPFLSSAGATEFLVTDNGGGSYTIDGVVHGASCGPTGSGTLFDVGVGSTDPGGTGSISITALQLRDCSNGALPVDAGGPGTVPIDN